MPPIEVTEVDRMYAAVGAILRNGVPMLLVRGQMSDLVTRSEPTNSSHGSRTSASSTSAAPGIWSPAIATTCFAGAVVEFLARHGEAR